MSKKEKSIGVNAPLKHIELERYSIYLIASYTINTILLLFLIGLVIYGVNQLPHTLENDIIEIVEEQVIDDKSEEIANPCLVGDHDPGVMEHTSTNDEYKCSRCGLYRGPRYGFTNGEIRLLAQLLCGDRNISGDGEYDFIGQNDIRYDQISVVLCVVMNRVRSDVWPTTNTVRDVVLRPGQFSVMPANLNTVPEELAIQAVEDWCMAYDRWDDGVQTIPEDYLYFRAGPNNTNIAGRSST